MVEKKKKRGRKPKTSIKKVPKKRGRKPKGGKIITKELKKLPEKNEIISNIILHLKCKTADLNENGGFFSDCNYNPLVNKIESYSVPNNTKTNLFNYEIMEKEKEKEKEEEEEEEEEEKKNGENGSDIKLIWDKLNKLSRQLRTNNVLNKKSDCFWCTCSFNSQIYYIPKSERRKIYEVYGCFCTAECAVAHLFSENLDSSVLWERYALLNNIYGKILNYTKNIKPAPNPRYILDKYYGKLSIEEYRKLLKKDNLLLIVDKPLTKIFPELYDDNNENPKIYSNLLNEDNNTNFVYRLKSNQINSKKKNIMQKNFNF
jgi:hypothetical protein